MASYLFRSITLFIGVVAIGSVVPDVFRFIQGKEWLGHSFLIPTIILAGVGATQCLRFITDFLFNRIILRGRKDGKI